jgi:hypothetical protein
MIDVTASVRTGEPADPGASIARCELHPPVTQGCARFTSAKAMREWRRGDIEAKPPGTGSTGFLVSNSFRPSAAGLVDRRL